MKKITLKFNLTMILFAIFIFGVSPTTYAQKKMDRIERQTMKTILGAVKNDVKEKYYDQNFKGIDIEEKYEVAKTRMEEVATVSQALGVIAQFLMDFDDSHLFFQPPLTNIDVEYGWRMKMIGNKCFVTTVKKKSDAEKKGLKPGDQILAIEGFRPNRKEIWKINYYYNRLSKRPGLNLTVLKPKTEKPVKLAIKSDVKSKSKVITKETYYRLFPDKSGDIPIDHNLTLKFGNIGYWKMPSFSMDPNNIDTLISTFDSSASLILDLRSNGGGYVVTLERLVSHIFDRDIKIAELKGRKEMDPQEAKTKGDDAFKGKLIVLIDSDSGSAAEIFARLVQLEKRGIVLGDVSAGAVMQSRSHINSIRNDAIIYGLSITNADVIMSDGKSLEHIGVMPNQVILPTASDLAKDRDPVLSAAVKLLGGSLSPEKAGKLFKYTWRDGGRVIMQLDK